MLAYLLDENISYTVAEQLAIKELRASVQSIYHWRAGTFVGQQDGSLLRAANQDRVTLVTDDLRSIPDLLTELYAEGETHAGVIFVDDASIRGNNIGGLVLALMTHWRRYADEDWTNRVAFLEPV